MRTAFLQAAVEGFLNTHIQTSLRPCLYIIKPHSWRVPNYYGKKTASFLSYSQAVHLLVQVEQSKSSVHYMILFTTSINEIYKSPSSRRLHLMSTPSKSKRQSGWNGQWGPKNLFCLWTLKQFKCVFIQPWNNIFVFCFFPNRKLTFNLT